MKRVWCVITAALMLCGALCGCQTQEPPVNELDPNYNPNPIVVPIGERTEEGVKITIHAGLLGMDPTTLTETQIADGFLDAVRNEDESVTYTIATDRYDAFVVKNSESTKSLIRETVSSSYASVTDVEIAEDLSAVTLKVIRADYEYSVDALAVFSVGSMAIIGQAYDLNAPGSCVITVVDENGEQLTQTFYPEELII